MTGDRLTIVIEVDDVGDRWDVRGRVDVDALDGLMDVDALRVAGRFFVELAGDAVSVGVDDGE